MAWAMGRRFLASGGLWAGVFWPGQADFDQVWLFLAGFLPPTIALSGRPSGGLVMPKNASGGLSGLV